MLCAKVQHILEAIAIQGTHPCRDGLTGSMTAESAALLPIAAYMLLRAAACFATRVSSAG